jgi:hypothetical protein
MRRRARTAFLLVGLLLTCLVVPASVLADERDTLRGIRAIKVVVENLKPDVERDGLNASTLQTDVELKLRQAGIRVEETTAYLYVRVTTLKREAMYAYSMTANLSQHVVLVRDPAISANAVTWNALGGIGMVGSARLSVIRDYVRDVVDEFVNAYLAANPKR